MEERVSKDFWQRLTLLVGALLILCAVYAVFEATQQRKAWNFAQSLTETDWKDQVPTAQSWGDKILPYLAFEARFSENVSNHRAAGQVLLAVLQAQARDLEGAQRKRWQQHVRDEIVSEKISATLRDEDAVARLTAEKIENLIGLENDVERDRFKKYQECKTLLEKLHDSPKSIDEIQKAFVKLDVFGVPFLSGAVTDDKAPLALRENAATILKAIIGKAYRDDPRQELVAIFGKRRLREFLKGARDADVRDSIIGVLSEAPKIESARLQKFLTPKDGKIPDENIEAAFEYIRKTEA
jgi:hypothetical protein